MRQAVCSLILLVTLAVVMSGPAQAAVHCVRAGATGAGTGTNWTDAYPSIPSTLVRGDTYYVADGDYGDVTFDDPISGDLFITVKKAVDAAHGPASGWAPAYGDGVAVFRSVSIFSSRWIFDGSRRTGKDSGHGFRIVIPGDKGNAVREYGMTVRGPMADDRIDSIRVLYTEFTCAIGEFPVADQYAGKIPYYHPYGGDDVSIAYCYLHHYIGPGMKTGRHRRLLVEHNYLTDNLSYRDGAHGDGVQIWDNAFDCVVRYNEFYNIDGTSMINLAENQISNLHVYGNVFHYGPDTIQGVSGPVNVYDASTIVGSIYAYNNTLVNWKYVQDAGLGGHSAFYIASVTSRPGAEQYCLNNIWYNCHRAGSYLFERGGYHYLSKVVSYYSSYQPEPTSIVTGVDPFVNSAELNFRPAVPVGLGLNLSAQPWWDPAYDSELDADGRTRGADGVWDIGAYEYVDGLHLTSPVGGEIWHQGVTQTVTWSSSGVTDPVRIELFKGGVLNQVIAENQAVANGSYTWAIPANQAADDDYTIKLTAGAYSDTSGNFAIAAPGVPEVTTDPAVSVTQTGAVLRGRVHPMGLATSYRFEYGLTTAYGSSTVAAVLPANADQTTVQTALSGLSAGTVYHFRLVAENSAGASEGFDRTFTTASSGGGSGSSDGEGGGGGGGCFVATMQSAQPGLVILILTAVWAGWIKRRVKKNENPYLQRKKISRIKKSFIAVFMGLGLLIFANRPLQAAVIQAASCSYADVSAAVAAARPGDTVRVPAGTAAWTSSLTIGKAIGIIGAGPGGTTLTASGPLQNGFFYISGFTSVDLMRISGFTFRLNDITASSSIFMYPNNLNLSRFRIDHNEFHNGYTAVFLAGAKGTVDHNRFVNAFRGISFTAGTRAQADASWESMSAGSADAMFIEDNLFVIDAGFLGTTNDQCLDTHNGGKLVIRYNHVDGRNTSTAFDNNSLFWVFQSHGNACGGCSGSGYWQSDPTSRRGQSVVEIYNNLVEGKRTAHLYTGRGSTNLIFNNVTNCSQHMSGIYFYEEEQSGASNWNSLRTAWPAEDQVHNTHIWSNMFNGAPQSTANIAIGETSGEYIRQGRDFFLHEPRAAGGREVFTGRNGAAGSYPTDGVTYQTLGTMIFTPDGPNAHYPYVPYIYPHPLTVQGESNRLLNLQGHQTDPGARLAWNAVNGSAGYRVQRDWGAAVPIDNATLNYVDDTAGACYLVEAVNADGKVLAAEGVVIAPSNDTEAPSVPSDLKATAISGTRIDLNWNASADNRGVAYYRIIRDGNETGLSTTLFFSDTGVKPATKYLYSIKAYDAAGNGSAESGTVGAETLPGGGGGGSSGAGEGGGGGGGCFVAAAQANGLTGRCLEWLELAILPAILLLAIVAGGNHRPGKRKKIIMGIGLTVSALLIVCGAAQAAIYYVDFSGGDDLNN